MSNYKAVFIDLDGTLLNHQSLVSTRNREVVQTLVKAGVHVVFATGRPIESIRQLLGTIHKEHPVISLSGSAIHKSLYGDPLLLHTLPYETVHSILEVCRQSHQVANVLMNDPHDFYALHANPEIEEFIGMFGKHPIPFDYDNLPKIPIQSMLIHAATGRRFVYDRLQRDFADKVHFTFFKQYPWIEIGHMDGNKGIAMQHVCDHLKISVDDAIAIGDGANDLEMIAAAGLGIAMENADDEVKAVSDRLAPHHDKNGVGDVLAEIFGIH